MCTQPPRVLRTGSKIYEDWCGYPPEFVVSKNVRKDAVSPRTTSDPPLQHFKAIIIPAHLWICAGRHRPAAALCPPRSSLSSSLLQREVRECASPSSPDFRKAVYRATATGLCRRKRHTPPRQSVPLWEMEWRLETCRSVAKTRNHQTDRCAHTQSASAEEVRSSWGVTGRGENPTFVQRTPALSSVMYGRFNQRQYNRSRMPLAWFVDFGQSW